MPPDDITLDEVVYPICPPCKRGEHDCADIMRTRQGGQIACGCTCGDDG